MVQIESNCLKMIIFIGCYKIKYFTFVNVHEMDTRASGKLLIFSFNGN